MPIQGASFKSVRKDKKRHLRNLRITSELKSINKKFESLINAKKFEEAKKTLQLLISKIGKAASKKIVHKNTASRKVSRLMKHLKKSERGLPDSAGPLRQAGLPESAGSHGQAGQ